MDKLKDQIALHRFLADDRRIAKIGRDFPDDLGAILANWLIIGPFEYRILIIDDVRLFGIVRCTKEKLEKDDRPCKNGSKVSWAESKPFPRGHWGHLVVVREDGLDEQFKNEFLDPIASVPGRKILYI